MISLSTLKRKAEFMSEYNISDLLIRDENYHEEMYGKVFPYINEIKEELYIGRSESEKLFCRHYEPESVKGVLVISHGFTETTVKFAELVYYFLKADIAVYVHDHCGHGKSYRLIDDPDKVHVDSYERYVKDLIFIAEQAKAAHPGLPLYLFGHSMGGGIAAGTAAYAPDLFTKVVLSSPMIRPATGSFPWFVTRPVCWLFAHCGKAKDFAPGQAPFDGKDDFEGSAATSKARYDYYNEIRKSDRDLQMNGATYGWLFAAVKLNVYLQGKGYKKISAPVLLFQAENETFVINEQQELFIEKLKGRGVDAKLIHVPGTKHEIYRSEDTVLEGYLAEIMKFYGVI